jgi:hypothetical protein
MNPPSSDKLTVRTFTKTDDDFPDISDQYVLFEGSADSLRSLAEFILEHLRLDAPCAASIHPNGAGSAHFSSEATVGIFLHRLPCDLHPENTVR